MRGIKGNARQGVYRATVRRIATDFRRRGGQVADVRSNWNRSPDDDQLWPTRFERSQCEWSHDLERQSGRSACDRSSRSRPSTGV